MTRLLSNEFSEHDGQKVEGAGWVHGVRDVKKLFFAVVRDRAGKVQLIAKTPAAIEACKTLGLEDVVAFKGTAKKNPSVKMGGVEIELDSIEVISKAASPLPVDIAGKTDTNFENRFDHRAMDLRRDEPQKIFRLRHTLCSAFREFLTENGFLEIHTPKIIATGTEGGTSLFPVTYFEKQAFLAQSPQFYKQMLVGAGFERVFEIAPVFRAEEHNTPYHLNEYISLDLEMGFIKDETDVMKLCEEFFSYAAKRVNEENKAELEHFNASLEIPKQSFPVVRYWDLPKLFESYGKNFGPNEDLTREHEAIIGKWALEKHKSRFVFVDNYPSDHRPAYTMPYEENKAFTRGYDVLFDGVEIVTGGQRIHDEALLEKRFKAKGFDPSKFGFYFEVFKYGMPPHGGQAIGLERLTTRILGIQNVREAAFFPRDRTRVTP